VGERFLDKVLHFMGIQEDDDDEQAAAAEDIEDSTRQPVVEEGRKGRVVNLPGRQREHTRGPRPLQAATGTTATAGKWRISVIEPTRFEDVQVVCDHLKHRWPVLVCVEGLEKELSKRIIDFVSGTTYAIDGQVQRVSEGIFIFAPSNVVIDADIQHDWEEESE
jgi:cell division inhibitor SepF